jgi:2-methylcitrate dehydratase PrpD
LERVLQRVVVAALGTITWRPSSDGIAEADALEPARDWLMHALGRACLALRDPDCAPLLGPAVPGATLPLGARVPGTSFELDPACAAFNLGAMIRGERGCPADHVAAALAAADYASRRAHYEGVAPPTVADLLAALRRAEALGRALAGEEPCRSDPWLCQRVADAFVATALLGGSAAQQFDAAHRASLDGSPAAAVVGTAAPRREQRRAAGENAARALRHALAALREAPPPGAASRGAAAHAAVDAACAAVRPSASLSSAPSVLQQPCLGTEFAAAVAALYPPPQAAAIVALFGPAPGLEALAVDAFVARLVRN